MQYVFKSEAHGFRTVHEELAKGMTFDLKSNEHSAVRNVLKVWSLLSLLLGSVSSNHLEPHPNEEDDPLFFQFSWFFFELIIKSMAQHLVDFDKVKVRCSGCCSLPLVRSSPLKPELLRH